MVYVVRSGIMEHLGQEATFESAKEITKYMNEKFADMHWDLVVGWGGRDGRIAWIGKFESIAAFQAAAKKLGADDGYQARVAKWRERENKLGRSSWVDGLSNQFWTIEEV